MGSTTPVIVGAGPPSSKLQNMASPTRGERVAHSASPSSCTTDCMVPLTRPPAPDTAIQSAPPLVE